MLAPRQAGRLLPGSAFHGAGGELTFAADASNVDLTCPLVPQESAPCASRPGGEEAQIVKSKKGLVLIGKGKEKNRLLFII